MDGSEKLTSLFIRKTAKTRYFNLKHTFFFCNLPFKQKDMITTELYNEWLISLYLDRKKQKQKILHFYTIIVQFTITFSLKRTSIFPYQHHIKVTTTRLEHNKKL